MPEACHLFEPEEIMAYLDGELAASRAAEAVTHLEHCAECRKLAADLGRVSREMAAWQVETPRDMKPPQLTIDPQRSWLSRFPMPRLAFAAALACAAIGVFVFVAPRREPNRFREFDARLAAPATASEPAPQMPPRPFARSVAVAPPQPSAQNEPLAPAGPMIERTASLDLVTREFGQLRGRLDAILARHHGYLADLTMSTPQGSGRSVNATLRVPSADLDAALTELRQLGRVQSESQKGDDVTRAYADLVARLANSRNEEQRLTQIMAERTGRLSDVLEVERELARVRGSIEEMDAERRTTADQVAFATVNFTGSEEFHAQLGTGRESTWTRLRNAAVDGYENLAETVVNIATAAIRYLPSIALWLGLIYFAVVAARRWRGTRA